MCVRPLLLKSNKTDYLDGIDRTAYSVPCGHCYECRRSHRSDYEFRMICHYLSNPVQKVYFYTLTYNEENLPRLDYNGSFIAAFYKPDVQKFLKRLRKRLTARGWKMKYFISSEYGEKRHRPHYHAIFFLEPVEGCQSMDGRIFRSLITETWPFGFNRPGQNYGLVKDVRPLSYVAKYTTKDVAFTSKMPPYKSLKSEVFSYVNNRLEIVDDKEMAITEQEYKKYFPFHLQSIGLGLDALKSDKFKFTDDAFVTSKIRVRVNGEDMTYPIPLYFVRKCLYYTEVNANGNIVYRLNERGYEVRKRQIEERISVDARRWSIICNAPHLVVVPKGQTIEPYLPMLEYLKGQDDFLTFLATYKNFYRGCEKMSLSFTNFDGDYETYKRNQLNRNELPFCIVVNQLAKLYDIKALEQAMIMFETIQKWIAYAHYCNKTKSETNFKIRYYGKKFDSNKTEKVLDYDSFLSSKFF